MHNMHNLLNFTVVYKLHVYNTYFILDTHNKHILYAEEASRQSPYPKRMLLPPPLSKIPGSVFAVVHHVIYVNQASDRDFFHNVKRMFLFLYDKWNKLLRNINLLRYNYKKNLKSFRVWP